MKCSGRSEKLNTIFSVVIVSNAKMFLIFNVCFVIFKNFFPVLFIQMQNLSVLAFVHMQNRFPCYCIKYKLFFSLLLCQMEKLFFLAMWHSVCHGFLL